MQVRWGDGRRARRARTKVDVVTKNRKRNGYSMTTQIQYVRILDVRMALRYYTVQNKMSVYGVAGDWQECRDRPKRERERAVGREKMARIGGIILFVKYVLVLVDSSDCISV